MNGGLGHPPQRSKVNKGPPQEKNAALPLSPPFKDFSLSFFLLELSLSLVQVDKGPLSLAWVHGSKVGLEVALHFPSSLYGWLAKQEGGQVSFPTKLSFIGPLKILMIKNSTLTQELSYIMGHLS